MQRGLAVLLASGNGGKKVLGVVQACLLRRPLGILASEAKGHKFFFCC